MRFTFAAIAILLSACSTNLDRPYFNTSGIVAPDTACSVDPREFAKAEPIADFSEGNGCEVHNAFRVYAMSGVAFSQPAIIRCPVADTFNNWLNNTVQKRAQSIYGQKISALDIADTYSCRPRNNVRGSKLSEHGLANAVDIAGFTLANGKQISVLNDWNGSAADQSFLRAIRQEACGPFHTVLGPGSDAYHNNHIHLDLQHERSGGPYCH